MLATERVRGMAGWPDAVHPQLVLRKFACPSCGSLLDSEVALPEDPYLYDVVIG
jgi:acetone carboxylase gamma subunit